MKSITQITPFSFLILLTLFLTSCPKEGGEKEQTDQVQTDKTQTRDSVNKEQTAVGEQVPCPGDRTETYTICKLTEADAKAEAERLFSMIYECDPACVSSYLRSDATAKGICDFRIDPPTQGTEYEVVVKLECR